MMRYYFFLRNEFANMLHVGFAGEYLGKIGFVNTKCLPVWRNCIFLYIAYR